MDKHYSRKDFKTKYFCSVHNEELCIDSDLTKLTSNSAYEVNIEISIIPCKKCKNEIDYIKNAIKILKEI